MTIRCLRRLTGFALASLLSLFALVGYAPPALATPTTFQNGSLLIPMDTAYQNFGMFKAYGLVYRLLQNGIPVRWAIGNPKSPDNIGGVDFTATTVDHYTSVAIGSPYSYTGGPFVIDSTDAAAALPIISAWRTANSNQPVIHRATAQFSANVDIILRRAPRIAVESSNADIAVDYFNAAGIPDSNGNVWTRNSPGVLNKGLIACNNGAATSCPAVTGDGALFEGGVCMARKYDVYVTPHNEGFAYSTTDPTNVGTHAYAELDNFVQQGGGWVALCHSVLSNEQAIYDLYTNGSPSVKALLHSPVGGGSLSKFGFPVDPENKGDNGTWTVIRPDLPFSQAVPTTAVQKLPGGAVQTWHAPDGTGAHIQYWDATERTAYFTSGGAQYDWAVNGVYHNGSGKGKMSWLGGHSYSTTLPYDGNFEAPFLRFFYNALFYNGAAVANMSLQPSVSAVSSGTTTPLQLLFRNTGASTATNVGAAGGVTITLQSGITYVGMAFGPAPGVAAGPGGTTVLTFGNLGSIAGGANALVINATAYFATPDSKQIATINGTYGDDFNQKFTDLSCADLLVNAAPAAVVTKTPAQQTGYVGDEVVWTITYSNPGLAPLLNPAIDDSLPAELQFHMAMPAPTFVQPIPGGGTHVHWTLATPLAPGASGTIRLSAVVQTRTGQPFTNNVTFSGTDANTVPYSASASALVNVGLEEASLAKTVSPSGTVLAGATLTYALSPFSPGPALFNRVRLFDALPEHTTYVPGSANQGGTFGAYAPLAAVDGTDAGPLPATNVHLSVGASPFTVASGDPVTVTMTLTNNAASGAITNVTPSLTAVSDGVTTCSGPTPPSLPGIGAAGGTGTFQFTCTIAGYGEIAFRGTASGTYNSASYNFVQGTSNSILGTFANTGGNVITWAPGVPNNNTLDVPGVTAATTMTLHAPVLVTGSPSSPATITLTQSITANVPVGLVTPGPLLATPTGAGTALPVCNVAPPSAPAPIADVPVNFTWTCTGVATTTTFGTLTFDAGASSSSPTLPFANATSNSVLLTPPLTFQAQVDPSLVATFDAVMNTGILSDDLAIAKGVGSNHVRTPVERPPVVSVIKSVNPASGSTVSPLAVLTYTLLVTNSSAGQATSLVVSDVVPPYTTYVPGSCTMNVGGPCALSGGTVNFNIGTLAGFQNATLTFQVTVNVPAKAGRYTIPDTATFAGNGSGGPISGSSNTVQSFLVAPPAATILKAQAASNPPVDANGRVIPGSTITYTLSVSNPANSVPATNVVVTDGIPAGTTFVPASCSVPCQLDAGPPPALTFNLPDIPAGGSTAVTFQVTVDNPADPSRFIINAGCVTVDGLDGRFSPPCSQVSYPISALPAILVEKTANPVSGSTVNTNDVITYTLRIRNVGNANTTSAYVFDAIPAGTTYVAGTTTLNGIAVPDPVSGVPPFSGAMSVYSPCCADPSGDGGVLLTESSPGGAANNAIVAFQVKAGGTAGLTMTINNQALAGTAAITPVLSNITTHVTPSFTDLAIVKSNGVTTVNAGGTTTYTLTVTNYGPSALTGAIVADPAPTPGLTLGAWSCQVSAQGTPGAVTTACGAPSGSSPLATTANLAVNGSVTYTIAATVTATSGFVSNTATVTPPQGVGNSGQTCLTTGGAINLQTGACSSTDTDPVTPVADVSILKSGPGQVMSNDTVTYALLVRNLGPSDAPNTVVKDLAVPGFTVQSIACGSETGGASCPAVQNTTVVLLQGSGLVLPALPAGGSVSITVTGIASGGPSIVNTGTVTPPPGTTDPYPGNNTSTVVTTIMAGVIPTLSPAMLGLLALLLGAVAAGATARKRT